MWRGDYAQDAGGYHVYISSSTRRFGYMTASIEAPYHANEAVTSSSQSAVRTTNVPLTRKFRVRDTSVVKHDIYDTGVRNMLPGHAGTADLVEYWTVSGTG